MFGAAHRSFKRHAEEEVQGEQRITKRLARMRIDEEKQKATAEGVLSSHLAHRHLHPSANLPPVANGGYSPDDRMYVDDTKDKIYIHDLDSEIARIEDEEPKGIFLADIDRKISAIPQQLLQNRTNNANTQMVLYRVPSSISVPEGQDHVRKAIIAVRARAREEQARKAKEMEQEHEEHVHHTNYVNEVISDPIVEEQGDGDADAMELG